MLTVHALETVLPVCDYAWYFFLCVTSFFFRFTECAWLLFFGSYCLCAGYVLVQVYLQDNIFAKSPLPLSKTKWSIFEGVVTILNCWKMKNTWLLLQYWFSFCITFCFEVGPFIYIKFLWVAPIFMNTNFSFRIYNFLTNWEWS